MNSRGLLFRYPLRSLSVQYLLPDIASLRVPSLVVEVVRPAQLATEDILSTSNSAEIDIIESKQPRLSGGQAREEVTYEVQSLL